MIATDWRNRLSCTRVEALLIIPTCYAYLDSKKTCSESPYRAHRSESRVAASPAPVVPSPDPVPFAIDEEAEEVQESDEEAGMGKYTAIIIDIIYINK
jgi:hypothetical protein